MVVENVTHQQHQLNVNLLIQKNPKTARGQF